MSVLSTSLVRLPRTLYFLYANDHGVRVLTIHPETRKRIRKKDDCASIRGGERTKENVRKKEGKEHRWKSSVRTVGQIESRRGFNGSPLFSVYGVLLNGTLTSGFSLEIARSIVIKVSIVTLAPSPSSRALRDERGKVRGKGWYTDEELRKDWNLRASITLLSLKYFSSFSSALRRPVISFIIQLDRFIRERRNLLRRPIRTGAYFDPTTMENSLDI